MMSLMDMITMIKDIIVMSVFANLYLVFYSGVFKYYNLVKRIECYPLQYNTIYVDYLVGNSDIC